MQTLGLALLIILLIIALAFLALGVICYANPENFLNFLGREEPLWSWDQAEYWEDVSEVEDLGMVAMIAGGVGVVSSIIGLAVIDRERKK